jgi:hypothetical protein
MGLGTEHAGKTPESYPQSIGYPQFGFRGRCNGIANTMGRVGANRIPMDTLKSLVNQIIFHQFPLCVFPLFPGYVFGYPADIQESHWIGFQGMTSRNIPKVHQWATWQLYKKKHLGDPRRKTKWGCNGGQNEDIVMKYYNIYIV